MILRWMSNNKGLRNWRLDMVLLADTPQYWGGGGQESGRSQFLGEGGLQNNNRTNTMKTINFLFCDLTMTCS